MEQIIHITEIIGNELLARSRAVILHQMIDGNADKIILDFLGVIFITRSFADELCNTLDDFNGKISCINMAQNVETMMTIVSNGRNNKRKKGEPLMKFHHFNDVKSLSEYISNNY